MSRDMSALSDEIPAGSWKDEWVIVTGSVGFLGQVLVRALNRRGVDEITVLRSREYDLCTWEAIQRLLSEMTADRPVDLVIHFDFRARTSFEEGLQRTVAWYLQTQVTLTTA